jgi:hypothetical protein
MNPVVVHVSRCVQEFFRDPPSHWLHSLGLPRLPAARCQPLCRCFSAPKDFTRDCSATDFISSGFSPSFLENFRCFWQTVVSFCQALTLTLVLSSWASWPSTFRGVCSSSLGWFLFHLERNPTCSAWVQSIAPLHCLIYGSSFLGLDISPCWNQLFP